jgi:hypothetical protein
MQYGQLLFVTGYSFIPTVFISGVFTLHRHVARSLTQQYLDGTDITVIALTL